MTKSAEDIIKIIDRIEGLKRFIGSIREESARIAFSDSEFSVFPLFYLADKISGDINDMEQESISLLFSNNIDNGEKVKAISSALYSTAAWTNVFAFNTVIEASNNEEVQADTIVPYSADEIIWGIINMCAIDSALTIPLKNGPLGYIKASLDDDGWTIPPLPLMFKNIKELYDNSDAIEEAEEILGHLTINDIVNLENFDGLKIENRPDLMNYLVRNQELALDLNKKVQKLMFDWTTIVNGD